VRDAPAEVVQRRQERRTRSGRGQFEDVAPLRKTQQDVQLFRAESFEHRHGRDRRLNVVHELIGCTRRFIELPRHHRRGGEKIQVVVVVGRRIEAVGVRFGDVPAIDIGRYLGAEIYATASRAKHDHLRELGAEPLGYDDEKIAELGAAVVFDPVLGDRFELSLSALAPTGRLVTCGALDSPMVSVNMWTIVGKRLRIIGSGGGAVTPDELDRIIGLVADGSLVGPVVDRELPLDQAAEAHRLIEERQTFGKVVLRP